MKAAQREETEAKLQSWNTNQARQRPTPSLFVTNTRSLTNKVDELELITSTQKTIQDCCVLVILETFLNPAIPEEAIQLTGHDRTADSGKSRGGGLCVYTNNFWCTNAAITDTYCSPDLGYLSVRCRPFYLLREFTVIVNTAVYIPPDANITTTLGYLLTAISKQQRAYPDGVFIIAGDFNRASLKTVLPKFHQHVQCPTRGKNILDHVYSNIKHGYKASPLPHLGLSDHISLFLTPAYRPLINRVKPSVKTIQMWPEGSSEQLRDCFSRTDWTVFVDDNIDIYTCAIVYKMLHR